MARYNPCAESVSVQGTVEVAARDFDGSILAVNICTSEGIFLVDDTPRGFPLLKLIESRVQVRGQARREDGLNILTIDDYQIL